MLFCVFHLGHLPIHEPNLSKNGSQSDENETYSDQEFDNEFREIPTFQPDYMKIESEFTPTEETVAGFNKVIIIFVNPSTFSFNLKRNRKQINDTGKSLSQELIN